MTGVISILMNRSLSDINKLINLAKEEGLTNSQEFLDYLDEINKLSVSY